MPSLKAFFQQHALWLGLVFVAVPLLSNLWLQYQALAAKEQTTPAWRREQLRERLLTVTREAEAFYRTQAEPALAVPPRAIPARTDGCVMITGSREQLIDLLQPVADFFSRQPFHGARRYFIGVNVAQAERRFMAVLFYHPAARKLRLETDSADWHLALVGFIASRSQQQNLSSQVVPYHYQPDLSLLVKPLLDGTGRLLGVAGMIPDERYFSTEYMPPLLQRMLTGAAQTQMAGSNAMIVTISDHRQRLRWSSHPVEETAQPPEARVPFSFIFPTWTLETRSAYLTEQAQARRLFRLNLALSALLALLSLGGLALSLRAAARAVRLSQLQADFVSNVSHELRTPLTSIRAFGEFLRLGRVPDPARVQKYGEYIEHESRRLTRLINNILDFSRIESGHRVYQFALTDVSHIVADTLHSFAPHLHQEGFALRFEAASVPLPLVSVDAEAIAQALINLLDNAAKYSGTAREIIVRLGRQADEVTISVTDYGIGIARAEQKMIFEKFQRVSHSSARNVKGSGLGLTIVRHIVAAHRGSVTVASECGQGSTFTIHLPVSEPQRLSPDQAGRTTAGGEATWPAADGIARQA